MQETGERGVIINTASMHVPQTLVPPCVSGNADHPSGGPAATVGATPDTLGAAMLFYPPEICRGGLMSMPFAPVYCATKHAVVGFSRSLTVGRAVSADPSGIANIDHGMAIRMPAY